MDKELDRLGNLLTVLLEKYSDKIDLNKLPEQLKVKKGYEKTESNKSKNVK